jgi:hypothetical protein
MIVGVILPIWDRVEGSETIKRLQTDDGDLLCQYDLRHLPLVN